MDDNSGGFSFGKPRSAKISPPDSESDADETHDLEAVEVDSEPVSRSEARHLGLVQPDQVREERTATAKIRRERLPADVGDELTRKLERAWNHLKRNEIEEALTLAQEVVFEYPSLVAAKLVIARCFINRREYDKALNILSAIPDVDKTPETLYYIGICLSRMDRTKEAIDILRKSRETSTDALIRKRSADLLQTLQDEQATCPVCGKKIRYDTMVEKGNRLVCASCAKRSPKEEAEEEEESEEDLDDFEDDLPIRGGKRRKRLRPPLSRTDLIIRALFAVFLIFVLMLGVYLLYLIAPDYYVMLRSFIPESVNILPRPPYAGAQTQAPSAPLAPRVIPTLVFSSPPLTQVVAEVEVKRALQVEGMNSGDGVFSVTFRPAPAGPYKLGEKTGQFSWTPTREDAGKEYDISFAAIFGPVRARDQVNRVKVSPGPEIRRVGAVADLEPGRVVHLLSEDLAGNGVQNLVTFSGDYWRGNIAILQPGPEGDYREVARAPLSGRPVEAGVILAGNEKWLAVADYWTSSFRFFAYRGNALSETAMTIELPGPPVLAAFNLEHSISAALYREKNSMRVVAYQQMGQLDVRQLGNWPVPDDFAWRRLLVLESGDEKPGMIVLLGPDPDNSILALEIDKQQPRVIKSAVAGTIVDALPLPNRPGLLCLTENSGRLQLFSVDASAKAGTESSPAPREGFDVGAAPALCGFTTDNLAGGGDLAILASNRVGISFGSANNGFAAINYWSLPAPARLFGSPVPTGGNGVIYVGDDGGLWRIGIAK